MATKRHGFVLSVVGGVAMFCVMLGSVWTAHGQSLPPGLKLHPLNFQNAGVGPVPNTAPTNAVANTNLAPLAHWLRQHLAKAATATNTGNPAQWGLANANASKSASAGVDDEAYWFRGNGTPSVIKVAPGKARRAAAVAVDEVTRDGNVRGFVRSRRAAMRVEDPDTEFEIRHREADSTGTFHYRLQQRFQGIKVWGGEAAVHLAPDGNVESMEGAFIPTPRGIATNPVVQLADAVQAISQRDYAGRGKVFGASELVINGTFGETPRLAWKFVMQSSAADSKRFLVDAVNGEILRATSLVCEGAVVGSGVDSLGVTRTLNLWQSGPTYYMVDTSKSMYAITSAPPSLSASKGTITIGDFAHSQDLNVADYSRSASPTSGWVPDAVSAAFGLSKVYDYYLVRHGRNSYDNKGNTLLGLVRYGSGLQNAFWTHPQDFMIYGDGFAASLDVCGHEVTHGVMFNTGDGGILDYANQSGALNEALADIFGEMVEARTYGTNDWLMGSQLGAPIRSMANPTLYGQPSTMSQYVTTTADNGGVHINSGIFNHAFYLLAVGLPGALGNGDAERIFYRAMTLHLLKQSQFIDARHACVSSAEELFGIGSNQALQTGEAFDAVGILDAPPTAPPGTIPAVQAPDSTLCLRYDSVQGAYYLVRRETALADPSTGTTVGIAWYLSPKRVSVSGDGTAAIFVGADYDFGVLATDGSFVDFAFNPGAYHSAALSPDGSRAALILRNQSTGLPDNTITILNLVSGGSQTFTLYGVTSEGGYIDVVDHADVMDFTADGRFLIYDAYCFSITSTGDILAGWAIFAMDTTTGSIQTLLDLNTDYDIGNPALGNTHGYLITLDVMDKATGNSTVISGNLATGYYGVVGTTYGMGVPGYTGDDSAVVFSQYDASATSLFSLYRRTLAADGITPTGAASLWLQNSDYSVIYRRGTYYPSNAAPQAALTFPLAGQVFAAPTNVVVQATASDFDGTVSKVEFYVDSTKIGTDTTAPYSMIWTSAPVGSHRITARAIDNLGGSGDSTNLLVFVLVPPALTSQPQSKAVVMGTNFTFTVTATGTAPLFYQWRKDGNPLPGATNTSYNIAGAITNDAGIYSVIVSNAARTVTSTNATLVVNVPPSITTQPLSQSVIAGSNVNLLVTAAGTLPLKYQWRTNGVNLTGATNATYAIANATTNAARIYSVVVTNVAGSVTSSNAILTVLVPAAITANPTNRAIKAGSNTTFTVTATGTAPLWYQWRKDTFDLASATNSSLTITAATTNDAGVYSVLVTNIAGSVLSSNATLTVNVPPAIMSPPQSLTVVRGSNALFSVTATGTAPLRYQWRSNAVNVVNATNASFTITNVQTNHAASYSVRVTNIAGSVTSAVASLTVLVPPALTAQPTNRTVVAGTNWTFACAATGTSPLVYQWRKNGTDIAGATNSSLPLANIQTNDSGAYTVLVTNIAGSALSSNATLSVLVRPTIVEPPQSLTAVRGSNVTFSVLADGTLPLRYRWRSNAVFIVNATNTTYTIANVQTNHAASYSVVITNVAGSVTSAVASLTVLVPPTFTVQPVAKTVLAGSNVTFTATATGTAPLAYQWRKDAGAIPDATNSSYNLPSAQTNNAGSYSVVVTNLAGAATSSNAALVVNARPTIVTQPATQSAVVGADVTFAVGAGGTAPLRYQWRKNAVAIGGATNDVYALANVQTNAAADYTVIVTNSFGSVTSAVVTLTINLTPPVLNFAAGGGSVVMSWSTNWPGFTLQSTTNMNLPGSWVSNPPPPVVSGACFVVTNAISGEQRFYRLKK